MMWCTHSTHWGTTTCYNLRAAIHYCAPSNSAAAQFAVSIIVLLRQHGITQHLLSVVAWSCLRVWMCMDNFLRDRSINPVAYKCLFLTTATRHHSSLLQPIQFFFFCFSSLQSPSTKWKTVENNNNSWQQCRLFITLLHLVDHRAALKHTCWILSNLIAKKSCCSLSYCKSLEPDFGLQHVHVAGIWSTVFA